MSGDLLGSLEIVLFGVLVLSFLVEATLSGTWNRTYFTSGLLVFARQIPVGLRHTDIPRPSRLEAEFKTAWTNSLAFREIEPGMIGFREKTFEFRLFGYTPVMHGLLLFDSANNEVVAKGFVNWFTLCFSVVWFGGVWLIGVMNFHGAPWIALAFIAFFFVAIGLMYWIQCDHYSKVAAFAAQEWERKSFFQG